MTAGISDTPLVEVPFKVHFFDTDAGGIVHNLAYLRFIEAARTDLAESMGWTLKEMSENTQGCPAVLRTEIDYFKPARIGDQLKVRCELTGMEKIRFFITSTVIRLSDQASLCQAVQTLATLNLRTFRPMRLRGDWRKKWPDLCKE